MKNSTKIFLGAISLAGVAAATAPAFAQDAPPWALTGYVAATSDYRFRGISQNERNFAPQGSLNVTGPEGFYVGAWASEGQLFRSGRFPQVSRNGDWEQVGHYTQMIWPGSLRVGCALRSSARDDYFVCRYSPAGNVMGVILP